ncbi:MAG TPA: DPP IV N-terminal domain-containing protein [Anaerolineales bacterium]|nr:DPP IV N-terminal domain-containing protein [Anaerolineales bacterium]
MIIRKPIRPLLALAAAALLAGACTVQLDGTSLVPTPVPPARTGTETTVPTDPPPVTPTATIEGATTAPIDWFGFPYLDDSALDYEVLPGWESLGLDGSVVFLSFSEIGQSVVVFDFETGHFAPVFVAPENTWVLSASLNPEHSDLLLSYAPVPPEGQTQYGYTDLYRLDPDGSLTPLLERVEEIEAFFSAFYSNSGREVYYSWFVGDDTVDFGFRYHIGRLDAASGEAAIVVEDGFWQAVSADDERLAYVTLNPSAGFDDPAELRVVPSTGGDHLTVLDPESFPTIDAPIFSPDGRYLYFSAVSEAPPPLSWLDRLFGVIPASAHNVPSDWWRADLETGEASQVSQLFDQGMYGDFSPDGDRLAFISATGLWIMNLDGSGLVQVLASQAFYGNLEWVR